MTPFAADKDDARRSDMFSPILAMVSAMPSATVILPTFAALIFSTSAPTVSATLAIIFTRPWNRSLRATKSVSELTSTTTPFWPSSARPMRPSAATRPAFLTALARPFLRSESTAASMSPSVSCSAALQSIMPAPVRSRSSFTICAVIVAMPVILRFAMPGLRLQVRFVPARSYDPDATIVLLCGQFFRLRDPAFHAAGQPELLADGVGRVATEPRDLPVVEDTEIVELLLDRGRDVVELLEVVGHPAGARQHLVAGAFRGRRQLFRDRLGRGAGVDAHFSLRARDAVDCGFGHQVAVQRDGAAGVVIAGHHEGDAIGIAIGVDDGGHRQTEAPRLLDRDVLLVGIDHEQEVGQAAHVLDAAERAIELVALALQREPLLLGVALGLARREHLVELAQPRDRLRDRLPVGQRAAEPARIDVVLRALLGCLGDGVLRLALGADEQDASAIGDRVAHRLQRAVQHRHGLGEIDDVDVVAGAEDVFRHLRIPAVGLMAEMHAGFQQLAHGEVRKR